MTVLQACTGIMTWLTRRWRRASAGGKFQAEVDRLCDLSLIEHDQWPGGLLSLGLAP